jgi:hypothetical protein
MAGRKEAFKLWLVLVILPAFACQAPAQELKSLALGTFHSPKGLGLCIESQMDDTSFDSLDIVADMFGILRGDYSIPGIKATYYRGIVLNHHRGDGFDSDFYAGPGVTVGYVRDIHEPFSAVAGMAGVVGGRLYFDSKRLVVCMEAGLDLALELNRNNRYRNIDLSIYKAGIYHVFYPQIRILYRLR